MEPLAKIEGTTLQQSLAFMPKRLCHVKETEIARFYRLTPTSIEPYGARIPRARVCKIKNQKKKSLLRNHHKKENINIYLYILIDFFFLQLFSNIYSLNISKMIYLLIHLIMNMLHKMPRVGLMAKIKN